ncbi:UBP1-associated protein 2C-like [Dendrobium catenatum]|uniref:Heterogeneous nuclear ribonucleoprotein 1 n=1 Tax=Dendrobium catenatum TaxID=906689 RepID=A0A2I0X456_9ASPA|nr:UBP1-associated protein 2C-like [Dendrobium catenatum]XP_028549550.1 UBP1-associated protein 2C-like [Dendrobium catenatum]PKU82699.1 Heterogeneous nuclear ribonucleoprotein 1 [Dendrobium catenatum]
MESEKGKGVATNDSVDNEGRLWNSFMEKHLRSLTQTLHKKEIVDLLVKLGMSFPQIAKEIRITARQYLVGQRLVVYGLHEETTTETLCDAFSSYGEIVEGHVMTDSVTGESRRFGFITFKNIESLQKALEEERKLVDGRLVLHQPANERFDGAVATADAELRRLYVGNIPRDVTTKELLDFFAKYGEIEEGSVIFDDQETRISKGYGFVTFKKSEDATNAINDPNNFLGTNRLQVKRANKYKPKFH